MRYILNSLSNPFLVDKRSLAITRIIFAILILTDLAVRFGDLSAHYTDAGILPLDALFEHRWYIGHWSVHTLDGSPSYQFVLFFISAFSAVMLLIGWKTRIFTFISWFFLASLNTRNLLILQAGDVLFRCLMFWAIFMPWGDRFSVDCFVNKKGKSCQNNKIFSLGSLAFMLQVVFMYVFTALIKDHPVWNEEYNAIYYALSMEQFSWLLGPVIYKYEGLMKVLTFSVFWIELIGPILFFIPYRNTIFRVAGILIFSTLQLGLMLTMWLGLFPFISLASLVIFIPSAFWNRFPLYENIINRFYSGVRSSAGSFFSYAPGLKPGISVRLRKYSVVVTVLIIFLIAYVFYWNLTTLSKSPFDIPNGMNWIARVFRVDQKWNMFAPHPVTDDGWFVISGTLRTQEYVDLINNGESINNNRPDDFKDQFRNYRWRKYLRNIIKGKNKEYRPYYGEYLCNKWNYNKTSMKQLYNVEMVYMQEKTLPDYKTEVVQERTIFKHKCGDINTPVTD